MAGTRDRCRVDHTSELGSRRRALLRVVDAQIGNTEGELTVHAARILGHADLARDTVRDKHVVVPQRRQGTATTDEYSQR